MTYIYIIGVYMKCKIFKEKTNRYKRVYNTPFISKVLNMYHDNYYGGFKHMKKSKKDKFNKRLKFYWSNWYQRNNYIKHEFKNHFKKIDFVIEKSTYNKIVFCKKFCNKCYCFGTNWDIRCRYNNNKPIHQVYNDCIYLKTFKNQFLQYLTNINYTNSDIEKYLNINRMVHDNKEYNLELLKDIFLEREHISIKEIN